MKRFAILIAVAVMGLSMVCSSAFAATKYPSKPITLICMFGPGGVGDLSLRIIAEHATKNGTTINVVNMTGGGGAQAGRELLRSSPDGYRFMFAGGGIITLTLTKNMGFQFEDLAPAVNLSDMPLTFCVRADSGIKTFQEFLEQAKANPGKLSYGGPSALSPQQMFMTLLQNKQFPGVNMPYIPYSSGHEVNTALLGKHVAGAFGVPGTNKNYLDSGEFRLLGVTSEKRLPEYPDAPTFKEMYGDIGVWYASQALYAHKDTPLSILKDFAKIVEAAFNDADVQKKFKKIGFDPTFMGPEEFKAHVTKQAMIIKEMVAILQK